MCDAEVRSRKGPTRWTSCKRSGVAVTIVTTIGSVLNYCERHADRVDDPERLHHMTVVRTTYHQRSKR